MKQTNNAIKFLMAQYRAIFQNAYFKGLATAAVVTMGLAAGQAQATETVNSKDTWEALNGQNLTGTLSVTGASAAVTANNTKADGFTLSLTGGDNKIQGTTNAVSLTAEQGTLKLATNGSALAVGASAADTGTTLNINAFDIQEGTLTVANTDQQTTTVGVKTVTLGQNGILTLTGGATAGSDTKLVFGDAATIYSLASGSKVNLTNANWVGDISNASGATFTLNNSTIKNYGTNVKAKIDVTAEKTGTIALANDPQTNKDEGKLQLVSGSTINIGGNNTSGAILNLTAGKLNLDNGVVLANTSESETAKKNAGTLKIGGGTSEAIISLNKETLVKFLEGTNTGAKKGILDIADSGVVLFTDDSVKLDGLVFGDDAAGKIKTVDGATLGGNKVVVDAPLTGATDLTVLAKDTLTLGKADLATATTDFGAKFETKNLKLVTDEDNFTLRNAVTLKAMGDGTDADGNAIKVAQEVKIEGKAINVTEGKSLTVAAGNYTFGENVTLTKGTLSVTSAEPVNPANAAGDKVASSLKLANANVTLKVTNSASGSIAVTGKNATLDLSEANSVTLDAAADGTNDATAHIVSAKVSAGTLILKNEEQVLGLVKMMGQSSNKASSINLVQGGTLKIVDDLTIAGAMLGGADSSSAPTTATINFHKRGDDSGGKLEVAKTLTLNDISSAIDIGKNGNIQADTLVLNPSTSGTAVELGSGNFTVLSGLETDKEVKLNSANATLNLGALEVVDPNATKKAYKSLSTGGEVNANLSLAGTSTATLHVVAGDWKAKDIKTVANTKLNVGQAADNTDVDGNIIGANLTVNGKLTAAAGVTVYEGSSLTTNEVELSAGSVTVSGGMVLNGKFNDNNTATDTKDDKFGVKLADGSIVLAKDSKLTIQGDAIKAIQTDASGNVTFASDFNTNVADGAIDSNSGSSLHLDFAEGKLSADGLKALNKKLFGDGNSPEGLVYLGNAEIVGLTPTNGQVSWSDAAKKYEDYLPTYTNEALMGAKLTKVESTDNVTGHFGSVVTDKITKAGDDVQFTKKAGLYTATTIDGDTTGNKYFALGKDNVVLGAKVSANSELTLANGGIIDHVTLAADASLVVDGKNGETKLSKDLKGEDDSYVELKSGLTTVEGKVATGFLESNAGSKLVVAKDLTLTGNAQGQVNQIEGDVSVTGKTTLSGDTTFAGNNTFTDAFKASQAVEFAKGVTQFAGNADFGDELAIVDGAQVTVDGILKLTAQTADIVVGEYSQADKLNSSGFLAAKYANLNGGRLVLDPAYGLKSSVAEIGAFTDRTTPLKDQTSLINGDIVVGQNSALMVGSDLASARSYLASLQDQNGSLSNAEGKIGSVLYINAQQQVKAGNQIIVDSAANLDTAFDKNGDLVAKYTEKKAFNGTPSSQAADLYLGGNAVLALGDGANKTDGAIRFASNNAAVYADKGAKIVLDGSSFLNGSREVTVFTDADTTNPGVKILGDKTNSIRVETVNGLMSFYLEAGKEVSKGTLKLDTDKVDSAFTAASAPMRDFLLGYTTLTKNWEEMYPRNGAPVAQGVKEEVLLGVAGPAQSNFEIDQTTGKITGLSATASESLKKEGFKNYVAVATGKDEHGKPTYDIYKKAYSDFLEKVVRNTNGAAADQAARMGDFGGAAETALVATSTTYDAVAGRFGMGQQAGTMTIANNGQGSGLWVTPVYKSHESDGFDADGLGYGSDITLYGVALGGDVTLANGVRVGAMFNVGSGDADGQGAASVVSNDFDYFGGSIYAGYAIDNFSIVGDVSYTTIDSDVEANTAAGKTSTSFDTTALSVGVTGQYALKVAEMDVTPHAGMRFTRIDMDDYTIDSADFGEVGQYNASSANVFSIPVGVTISKEYVTDTWTVKPSFDLTLTGNFGDDTVDGTVSWTGVSNYDVSTKAEFVDNFTYGAAVGIAAKTGNFGLGLGLNYTGSSNTDEFGVNANARYMF